MGSRLWVLGFGFRVLGLVLGVWCFRFKVRGLGFRLQGLGLRFEETLCSWLHMLISSPCTDDDACVVGFRDQGLGFRTQGPGSRVQGPGSRDQGPGSRVQGPGFRGQGLEARVLRLGLGASVSGSPLRGEGFGVWTDGARG